MKNDIQNNLKFADKYKFCKIKIVTHYLRTIKVTSTCIYQHQQIMEKLRIEGELMKEQMRIESNERIALQQSQAKVIVAQETADAKKISTDITATGGLLKQQIANEKKETASV